MDLKTVKRRHVLVGGKNEAKKFGHMFYGDGSNHVVESQRLDPGKPFVLTNVGGKSPSLITFAKSGFALGFETIVRPPVNENLPTCRDPMDKGMSTYYWKFLIALDIKCYKYHHIIIRCLVNALKNR